MGHQRKRASLVLAVVAAVAAAHPAARGVDDGAARPLGATYVDEVMGFSLRPPADSVVQRLGQQPSHGQVDRVRFQVEPKRWALTVSVRAAAGTAGPAAVLEMLRAELAARVGLVTVTERRTAPIASRAAAAAAFGLRTAQEDWVQHVAVIAMPPNRFLIVRLDSPAATSEAAGAALRATLGTLAFPGAALTASVVEQGRRHGARLLATMRDRLASVALRGVTYLRVERGDAVVGLVRREERRDFSGSASGIVVQEDRYAFEADRRVRHTRRTAFASDDLHRERWEVSVVDFGPGAVPRPAYAERGLREKEMLVVSYADTPGQRLMTNKTLEVPSDYIAAAAVAVLDRLADPKRTRIYAFSTYSPTLRAIMTRIVRFAGAETADVAGEPTTVFRIIDHDEVLRAPRAILVDAKGKLVRIERGPERLVPISQEAAERLLADRMRPAAAAGK